MPNHANPERSLDTELLTVHLTGLQAEIEAKLRYVKNSSSRSTRSEKAIIADEPTAGGLRKL